MTPEHSVNTIAGINVYSCPVISVDRCRARYNERMAAGALTRMLFGPDAGYSHRHDGSPYVEADGREIYVSVSHADGLLLMAVPPEGLHVGVDMERWSDRLVRIAHKFLTHSERTRYGLIPGLLLKAWTAKEAVFKAAGISGLVISRIETFLDCPQPYAIAGTQSENAPHFALHFRDDFPVITALAIPIRHP